VKCPSCRHENPETAQRCGECGSDLATDLPRTANRLVRVVTLAGAAVATIILAAEYASGVQRGVNAWGLIIFELLWVTPFAVAWLGLRFRPASLPLSVALGFSSGLGLCAYSEVLFRQHSVLGYLLILVPFVQLGWCLLWIALIWWLGDASGVAR
jgi:hypothetical protein